MTYLLRNVKRQVRKYLVHRHLTQPLLPFLKAQEVVVNSNPSIDYPQSKTDFLDYDYNWFCNANSVVETISVEDFDCRRMYEKIITIDVREQGELPVVNEFPYVLMPLSEFENLVSTISPEHKIVVFCKSGQRSLSAVRILKEKYPNCEAFSLNGGIENWKKVNNKILL